jgi:Ca-activated chloride channel family protein
MLGDLHLLRPAWLLALVPLGLLLWRLARDSRGAEAWRGHVDPHLLPHLLTGGARQRRWPLALLGLGWLLAVVALAGPVWQQLPVALERSAVQRVILLDLSPTMLAEDVAPSRLGRARLEVLDLLRLGADGQTALLVFGAEPFLVAPLTTDSATIAAQVPSLSPELLPVSGAQRVDLALRAAEALLAGGGGRPADVILVTDDLVQPASAFSAARELAEAGHRLSVLLVATADGAPGPSGSPPANATDGRGLAMPDRDALRRLVAIGGGRLVDLRADGADTQALLAAPRGGRAALGEEGPFTADRWREEGPWLLLLLLPLAALGFRRGWLTPALAVLFLIPGGDGQAGVWRDLWLRPDQQAALDLAAGRAAEAAERFSDPAWQAAARYQAGDYDGALASLAGLADSEAAYNRGNVLARVGRLREALAAYDRALELDPGHADAAHNRSLVERALKQQTPDPRDGDGGTDGAQSSAAGADGDSRETGEGDGPREAGGQEQDAAGGSQGPDAPADASADTPGEDAEPVDESAGKQGESASRGEGAALGSLDGGPPAPGAEPGREDLLGTGGPAVEETRPSRDGAMRAGAGDSDEREAKQAFEQMLRRVPDDPGGLLRQRFLLQHLRRHGQL